MAKEKTLFICQQCGNESAKWMGKCPNCGEWNSFVETKRFSSSKSGSARSRTTSSLEEKSATNLKDVKIKQIDRIKTDIRELDKALGGGIVAGQVLLLAGEPGIGKSTLLLQIAKNLTCFYATGEESLSQVKLRAERLGVTGNVKCISETNMEVIMDSLEKEKALSDIQAVFIDSVQTMYTDDLASIPGSVSQVKDVTLKLIRFAKREGIPVVLVGHVTKDGSVAGPSTLMHMVDTVCWFEGEGKNAMRILRIRKNRFGSTDEIALFSMGEKGLIGVDDLDGYLFDKDRVTGIPGSVATCIMEGSRTVLVEVQSLVNPTKLAIPRRVVQGIDTKRVELILVVLTKHGHMNLSNADVFVNVVGGLRVKDPAIDMAVAVSVASSFKNKPVSAQVAVLGEIGLLGDVRQTANSKKCLSHLSKHKLKVIGYQDRQINAVLKQVFK